MNGHSGDIAAAVMIGAAIMLALVLSAKADALSAQPSQIITSCGNNKPASRLSHCKG
jgi:hypothetical protein